MAVEGAQDQLMRQRGWYGTFLSDNTPICLHYQSLNLSTIDPAAYGARVNENILIATQINP